MEQLSSWPTIIAQLGFPIFVCIWFMWRDYKFLVYMNKTLYRLTNLIELDLKSRGQSERDRDKEE
jgi:hypothetical protein